MENHTFVIPAYKDSLYLEECIVSLKNQKARGEIKITTSTPSEYISHIAKKHSVEVIVNDSSEKGLAGDWNFAYSQAKTKLVTIAHQDEIYESDYLETIIRTLEKQKNKRTLIIFTDYREMIIDKLRGTSFNLFIKKILLIPFIIKSNIRCKFFKKSILVIGDAICCPTVTFNKEVFPDFSFSNKFQVNPDWNAWLEFAGQDGTFVYINKKLMRHRMHPETESLRQIRSGMRKKEEFMIFEMVWGRAIGRLISFVYKLSHKENVVK